MHRQRGFSLVEIMVALLILTIVITVSFTAFLQRNKRLQQASEMILAYQVLANEAEYQRRVPVALLENGGPFLSKTELLAPMNAFTVVRVDDIRPGVRNVTMTVRWGEEKREARLSVVRVATGEESSLW